MSTKLAHKDAKNIRLITKWLLICAAMVFVMALIGAATRLTESGLSIVYWKPISGVIPPLSNTDWQAEFAHYQNSPQYQSVNAGMSLAEFKPIFWWEFVHRQWGRLIGLVFFIPLCVFAWQRRLPKGFTKHAIGLTIVGGLQAVAGWWMVASGLIFEPRVSALRLMIHMGLAMTIFSYLIALAYRINIKKPDKGRPTDLYKTALLMFGLLFVTMLSGALMAGVDGGLAYPTYPLMNGHVIPPDVLKLSPWWTNIYENTTLVNVQHRMLTLLWLIAVIVFFKMSRHMPQVKPLRQARMAFLHGSLTQFVLGIGMLHMVQFLGNVPVLMGVLHQAVAMAMLIFATLFVAYTYPKKA